MLTPTPAQTVQPQVTIDLFNIPTAYLELGDVDKFAEPNHTHVTARDALIILQAAVGTLPGNPVMDIDGSANAEGTNSPVTASDALLALRIAVGLEIPPGILEHQEFRLEMVRWFLHQQAQNAFGLIEVMVDGRRVARTKDQALAAIAMLVLYQQLNGDRLAERVFSEQELLNAIIRIHSFYFNIYKDARALGTFNGFAEYYDVTTGEPVYTIGEGGNLAADAGYIAALEANAIGLIGRDLPVIGRPDPLDMVFDISRWLESPELERADGGVRFGIDMTQAAPQPFPFARTDSNLIVREAMLTVEVMAEKLEVTLGLDLSDEIDRLIDQIFRHTDFLELVAWNNQAKVFAAEVTEEGAFDERLFSYTFFLSIFSQFSLPEEFDRRTSMAAAQRLFRGAHPFAGNPQVMIDGFGTLDDSGVHNEFTLQAAFASNMFDSRSDSTFNFDTPETWFWAYLLRETAKARIDIEGVGSGLAEASSVHESGFGSMWDVENFSPSTMAWWILNSLDFHPFISQVDIEQSGLQTERVSENQGESLSLSDRAGAAVNWLLEKLAGAGSRP